MGDVGRVREWERGTGNRGSKRSHGSRFPVPYIAVPRRPLGLRQELDHSYGRRRGEEACGDSQPP